MSLRPYDHFNVGDELMVYIGERESKTVDGDWVPAICMSGYRYQDGVVTYKAVFPIHDNFDSFEGCGGFAGDSRPEVMLRSTFLYLNEAFESDPGFVELWIRNIKDDLKGFNPETFKESLRRGVIASPQHLRRMTSS